MDASTKSSPSSSLKSKKQLLSPDQKARKVPDPSQNPWSVRTPGKQADPPQRLRNRGVAMSIKEVREAAMKLRQRGSDPPAPIVEPKVDPIGKSKKPAAAEIKLPEKYELLDKFFNSLDSSIRLLQLKRSATTFTNISPQIETLTDRRFTYNHLAQLKFIMPEVIVVEKALRLDERTSCMKPDLRITLNSEAIESDSKSKSLSGSLQMRKLFRSRLLKFFKSHPEGDEIPEEALPEPFNRSNEKATANSVQPSTSETQEFATVDRKPVKLSHTSSSFKPFFMKRDQIVDFEDRFVESPSEKEINATTKKYHFNLPLIPSNRSPICASSGAIPSSPPETPVKCIDSGVEPLAVLRTPLALASTPSKLMTPVLNPPKRCHMSPDDDNSYISPSKLIRRPPPNRPLKFDTPVKNSKFDLEFEKSRGPSTSDDIFDILPAALIKSIQEKERLAAMERDPSISRAKQRRKVIASLPKRFDMIYFLFQSIRRSVITKEELIQKIIMGDPNVTDRGEVEEQVRLLQELAPEWIYEKSISSGDLMICVNKISSPEMIRTRLSEAK